jgi:hypothetical protein
LQLTVPYITHTTTYFQIYYSEQNFFENMLRDCPFVWESKWQLSLPRCHLKLLELVNLIRHNRLFLEKLRDTRKYILSSIQTRCKVIQYSLLLSMFYMFQGVSPPNSRS